MVSYVKDGRGLPGATRDYTPSRADRLARCKELKIGQPYRVWRGKPTSAAERALEEREELEAFLAREKRAEERAKRYALRAKAKLKGLTAEQAERQRAFDEQLARAKAGVGRSAQLAHEAAKQAERQAHDARPEVIAFDAQVAALKAKDAARRAARNENDGAEN